MRNFEALVAKLREIFQIDRPDLDFGVYRIFNARAGEIEDYLSRRLKCRVAEALSAGKAAGSGEQENQVFSHLLTFFSRYYDNGDFISQRRYKGDTYAIPYSGEEVVLHWANRDQYYTKSGEAFSHFSFKLPDGRSVQFRLVAADTAKDNRKDNDKERRFVLAAARTIMRADDEGEATEEEIRPVAEEDGALIIRFDYAAQPKGTTQASLIASARDAVLADATVKARWLDLETRASTDKNPTRTLLEKHLATFTEKNTADYFIHKDLGGFLRRELDFYIKNEVMNLDDVQEATAFSAIETNLKMIQCLRAIALDLITFLASLEDFQKKLWLKKKFVVAAHYCMTLDRVPETLYPRIAANPAQWAQWHELGMREDASPGSIEDLTASRFLMVDTALFDAAFRADLLMAVPDLDASLDGLLVHGDNFQAIGLLEEKFKNKLDYIYADPPYNTNSTPICYKNGFKHSSWASLIQSRTQRILPFLKQKAVMTLAIDDSEMNNLSIILRQIAPDYRLTCVTIVHNPKGSITKDFNRVHEYALFLTPEDKTTHIRRTVEENAVPRKMRRWGENSRRVDRRLSFYPVFFDGKRIVGVGNVPADDFHPAARNTLNNEGILEIWPIDQDGIERRWNFGLDSVLENLDRITTLQTSDGFDLFVTHEKTVPKTVWQGGEFDAGSYGNTFLIDMMGAKNFDFPKSIHQVMRSIDISTDYDQGAVVLDYFAGSGTTGHAVIELNRRQKGNRKYILIEQASYFDIVTKPRIQKAVHSNTWSAGKPTAPETGISHAFKVLKIEGYEDTLNNLDLKRSDAQKDLLRDLPDAARDDYLMRYMLDVESRGSLLSIADFRKPFDYTLKVAVDSAGAWETRKVDLVETFNYLIGLTVRHIDIQLKQGFATVSGRLPTGEKTLVLWRDCDLISYEELSRLCDKLAINPSDSEFDVVYINGDHNIPGALQSDEANGGEIISRLKLRQIEPAFLDAMFNVDDV